MHDLSGPRPLPPIKPCLYYPQLICPDLIFSFNHTPLLWWQIISKILCYHVKEVQINVPNSPLTCTSSTLLSIQNKSTIAETMLLLVTKITNLAGRMREGTKRGACVKCGSGRAMKGRQWAVADLKEWRSSDFGFRRWWPTSGWSFVHPTGPFYVFKYYTSETSFYEQLDLTKLPYVDFHSRWVHKTAISIDFHSREFFKSD
jgi:hypothetical protein